MADLSGNKRGSRRKRRGFASRPEIQAGVEQLAQGSRMTAAEIHGVLKDKFGERQIPHVRTVQDMVEEARTLEPSEPWRLADAKPEEIALVTPVWATALEQGVRLTNKQVRWIVRVRLAAPDLPPDDAWGMASLYATEGRFATEGVRDALDALLAFAPWRSVDHAERYFGAANSGRIPSPPLAWNLAKRGFLKEDGRYMAAADSQAAAFFQNQPSFSITIEGESVTIEEKPPRRKAGRP